MSMPIPSGSLTSSDRGGVAPSVRVAVDGQKPTGIPAQVASFDLSKIATLPTQDAIGILNDFSIEQLAYIFAKYPEINRLYGSLYSIGIVESRSPETKMQNKAAEVEKVQVEQVIAIHDKVEWRSADDYVDINKPGKVDPNVSKHMGSDLLRMGEVVVTTLPMLVDWWLVYLYSSNLVQGSEIIPDQRILDAFRSSFNNRGVSTDGTITINIFSSVVADEFYEGEVSLTGEAKEYLFRQAKHLRSILDKIHKNHIVAQ